MAQSSINIVKNVKTEKQYSNDNSLKHSRTLHEWTRTDTKRKLEKE